MILLLLVLITGSCPMTAEDIYVKSGELVMLHCGEFEYDTVLLWKKETDQKTHLYSNLSASEQLQLGLVVYQNGLVILSASLNHQGNYLCAPLGNTSSEKWFKLTVCPKQSKECDIIKKYKQTCYTSHTCMLYCPKVSLPTERLPGITTIKPKWYKQNGDLSKPHLPSVELKESGVYICTWSFFYSGKTYNTSFSVELVVQREKLPENLGIYSPQNGQVFEVQLGTKVEIVCKAVIDSCLNSLFWMHDKVFLDDSDYYTDSCNETNGKPQWMTATLVFREVSVGNLSRNFTCKFESDKCTSIVTINLIKKAQPWKVKLTIFTVCFGVLIVLIIVVYVKFKIDVTLILRDVVGVTYCSNNTSDGRSYDAFLMCYKSDGDGGLSEEDRKLLASTLEDQFGYSLCIYDRDVLPGQAESEAVLECVEQSRAVVLVPSFPDPKPGSGVLSAIYAALVERKTDLIFINMKTKGSRSGSFPEALQLLSKAGNSVTWKRGPPSLSFLKQLRYHLPAPQQTSKMQLLPQQC